MKVLKTLNLLSNIQGGPEWSVHSQTAFILTKDYYSFHTNHTWDIQLVRIKCMIILENVAYSKNLTSGIGLLFCLCCTFSPRASRSMSLKVVVVVVVVVLVLVVLVVLVVIH